MKYQFDSQGAKYLSETTDQPRAAADLQILEPEAAS
jgi:hypothetical protein